MKDYQYKIKKNDNDKDNYNEDFVKSKERIKENYGSNYSSKIKDISTSKINKENEIKKNKKFKRPSDNNICKALEFMCWIIYNDNKNEKSKQKISLSKNANLYSMFNKLCCNNEEKRIYEIDIENFMKFCKKYSYNYKYSIPLLIEAYDLDNDNGLNFLEFNRLILPRNNNYCRSFVTQKPYSRSVSEYDDKVNLDDIENEELSNFINKQLEFCENVNSKKLELMFEEINLLDLFVYLDKDKDSFLNISDFERLFYKYKIQYPRHEIFRIIDLFDMDKDEKLSFEEFLYLMMPSACSHKPKTKEIKKYLIRFEEYVNFLRDEKIELEKKQLENQLKILQLKNNEYNNKYLELNRKNQQIKSGSESLKNNVKTSGNVRAHTSGNYGNNIINDYQNTMKFSDDRINNHKYITENNIKRNLDRTISNPIYTKKRNNVKSAYTIRNSNPIPYRNISNPIKNSNKNSIENKLMNDTKKILFSPPNYVKYSNLNTEKNVILENSLYNYKTSQNNITQTNQTQYTNSFSKKIISGDNQVTQNLITLQRELLILLQIEQAIQLSNENFEKLISSNYIGFIGFLMSFVPNDGISFNTDQFKINKFNKRLNSGVICFNTYMKIFDYFEIFNSENLKDVKNLFLRLETFSLSRSNSYLNLNNKQNVNENGIDSEIFCYLFLPINSEIRSYNINTDFKMTKQIFIAIKEILTLSVLLNKSRIEIVKGLNFSLNEINEMYYRIVNSREKHIYKHSVRIKF